MTGDAGSESAIRDRPHPDIGKHVLAGSRIQAPAQIPANHLLSSRLDRLGTCSIAAVRRTEKGSFMKRPPYRMTPGTDCLPAVTKGRRAAPGAPHRAARAQNFPHTTEAGQFSRSNCYQTREVR